MLHSLVKPLFININTLSPNSQKEVIEKKKEDKNLIIYSDKNELEDKGKVLIRRNKILFSSNLTKMISFQRKTSEEDEKEKEKAKENKRIINKSQRQKKNINISNEQLIYPSFILQRTFQVKENSKIDIYISLIKPILKNEFIEGEALSMNKHLIQKYTFAFITSFELKTNLPSYSLIESVSTTEERCNVLKYKVMKSQKKEVPIDQFRLFSFVYSKMISIFLNNPYDWKCDIDLSFFTNDMENKERRYFLLPVNYIYGKGNEFVLDNKLYKEIYEFYKEETKDEYNESNKESTNHIEKYNKYESLSDFIMKNINKQSNIEKYLKSNIFFTSDKKVLFDIKDILYQTDTSETFIYKMAKINKEKLQKVEKKIRNIDEIRKSITEKNFPKLISAYGNESDWKEKEINHEERVHNINENEYISFLSSSMSTASKKRVVSLDELLFKEETSSNSIITLRKYHENEKEYLKKPRLYGIGNVVKCIDKYNFIYNRNLNIRSNHINLKNYRKTHSVHSIIDLKNVKRFFLNWDFHNEISKSSSHMINFEQFMKVLEFLYISNSIPNEKIPYLTDKQIFIFMNSLTTSSTLLDFDYETLETIGDSILKLVVSYSIYLLHKEYKEGELVKERSKLICNDTLFNIGKSSIIKNFCFGIRFMDIKNSWFYPFQYNHLNTYHQNFNNKNIIDLVESLIAAFFYVHPLYSFNFIVNTKILPVFFEVAHNHEGRLTQSESEYNIKKVYQTISNSMVEISKLLDSNKLLFYKINEDIKIDSSFDYLSIILNQKNQKEANSIKEKDYKFNENYIEIEELIGYSFVNKHNLKQAFTPKSITSNVNLNLERLEFLGDSIIECYLMVNFMSLLYIDEEQYSKFEITSKNKCINQIYLTNCKSFLASNQFMGLLVLKYNLYKYIKVNPDNKSLLIQISNFTSNINFDYKLNSYLENSFPSPKLFADCLEALVGSILIDSNSILTCFQILDFFYLPFVFYCSKFITSIKFSPVAELTALVSVKKLVPLFHVLKEGENVKVQLSFKKSIDFKESNEDFVDLKSIIFGNVYMTAISSNIDRAKEIVCINAINVLFKD